MALGNAVRLCVCFDAAMHAVSAQALVFISSGLSLVLRPGLGKVLKGLPGA